MTSDRVAGDGVGFLWPWFWVFW